MYRQIIVAGAAIALILTGCSRETEPKEETPPPVSLLFQDVRAELDSGKVDAAVSMLDKAMEDKQFADDRPAIFNAILSIQLSNERTEEAVARYLAMVPESPDIAEYSFPVLARSLQGSSDPSLLLKVTTHLLDAPFSDRTRTGVYITHAYALVKNNKSEAALQLIDKCSSDMSEAMCVNVYRGMINAFISSGHTETATRAIDRIAAMAQKIPELKELVAVSRLRILAAGGEWKEFEALFSKEIESLTDHGANTILNRALNQLKNKPGAVTDQLCSIVIENRKPEDRSVLTAARTWIRMAENDNPSEIVRRTAKLVDKGIAADQLVRLLRTPFYEVLNSGDAAQLRQMTSLVEEISASLSNESDIVSANGMVLDGSFILNDYDKAIAMVEKGVSGRDENWHKSALAKLKAHRSLDSGNIDEAVKYFREFMKVVEETMDSEIDPSTGLTYTANWCLGRNAKRIGDLLKKNDNAEGSAEAYKEAKDYFKQALEEFPETKPEYKAIHKEMQTLPESE